jgi:hypothetical protein
MAPLPNVRHEKFVQALFAGKSATEAYTPAGYKPHQGNSSRLRWYEMVQSRLQELQGAAAKATKVTVESICAELDQASAVAKERGQAQALVSVATMRAKLNGLLTERIEVGAPGAFDGLTSTAAIVDEVLERLIEQFRPLDSTDRQALIDLYMRHLAEVQEFIDAINARPLIASRVDPRRLDVPWDQHEPYAPKSALRIGYRGNGGVR